MPRTTLPQTMAVTFALCALILGLAQPTRAGEISPTHKEIVTTALAQDGTRWYGIYVMGKKVGWQRDKWEVTDKRACNEVEFSLKMAFLGQTNSITVSERACYELKPPFYLESFAAVKNESGNLINIEGKRQGEELVYEIDTGNQKRTSKVPADHDLLSHVLAWAGMARMQLGDHVNSFTFDEITAKKQWLKLTLQSVEKKTLMGARQKVYKVLMEDERGMKLDALLTEDGILLEGSMGPSMRIVLEDQKTATRTDLELLDLYSSGFITATGTFDFTKVSSTRKLKLKLTGDSAIELAPNRRQKLLERGANFVVVEIDACPAAANDGEKPEKFLECSADVPCDLKEYRDLAKDIAGQHVGGLNKATAITTWVHKNFTYKLGAGGGTADLILKDKTGDCTEFSKATITLLRAAGLPARQLSGVVPASDHPLNFGYHAWVEVWLKGPGWTMVDPTWGHHPVDATHIVFDVDEGLQMFAHLGGLKIEILEVEYQQDDARVKCEQAKPKK